MLTGKCLCEAVRFEIDGRLGPIVYCHCSSCRRATGSAFLTAASVKAEALRVVAGADLLRQWGGKVSCSRCASILYREFPEYAVRRVHVGALDGDPGTRPVAHIFIGSKGAWDTIPDDGLQRFEELAPSEYFMPG